MEAVITGIRGSTLANSDVSNVGRLERKDILAGNAMSRSDGVAGFDELTVRKLTSLIFFAEVDGS